MPTTWDPNNAAAKTTASRGDHPAIPNRYAPATTININNNAPANNNNASRCPPNKSALHHDADALATPGTVAVPYSEKSIVIDVAVDSPPAPGNCNDNDCRTGSPSAPTHNSPAPDTPSYTLDATTRDPGANELACSICAAVTAANAGPSSPNSYLVTNWPPSTSTPATTTSRAALRYVKKLPVGASWSAAAADSNHSPSPSRLYDTPSTTRIPNDPRPTLCADADNKNSVAPASTSVSPSRYNDCDEPERPALTTVAAGADDCTTSLRKWYEPASCTRSHAAVNGSDDETSPDPEIRSDATNPTTSNTTTAAPAIARRSRTRPDRLEQNPGNPEGCAQYSAEKSTLSPKTAIPPGGKS